MKVNIFTEAGNNIGWGHVSRCLALYEELNDRKIEVQMIIYGEFNHHRMLDGFDYIKADWKKREFLERFQFKNSYAIVDSYQADFDTYKYISDNTLKSLFIDDTNRLEYPSGIVLNPSFYVDNLNYKARENLEYIFGEEYIILRKAFRQNITRINKQSLETVLIAFGGIDRKNYTIRVLDILTSNFPKLKLNVVINSEKENLYLNYKNNPNLKLFQNLSSQEMLDLYLASDFCIAAASQTVLELIATKTSFLPVLIETNQINLIQNLTRLFYLDYIDIRFTNWEKSLLEMFRLKINALKQNIILDIDISVGVENILNTLVI